MRVEGRRRRHRSLSTGAPAVHRDGEPVIPRGVGSLAMKRGHAVVGSRMRERRMSGSERGRGTIEAVESVYSAAGPALSTPRRPAADSLPASRRNSGSSTMTAADRGPALLALTSSAPLKDAADLAADLQRSTTR